MLPVVLMEPASYGKRRRYSEILLEPKRWLQPTLEDVKQRLKEIRNYSLAHFDTLVAKLTASLAAHSEVEITFAQDAGQAVEAIKEIARGAKIAINKSSVIANELVPTLVASGYNVIESYYDEFEPFDNKSSEYWQLPVMTFESRFQSFERSVDLTALRSDSIQKNGIKDFIGLLGVNAISAEEGTVLMLQHMHNISKVFEQAKELILVASLDKIVRSLDDAIFQTKCMAIFGSEALPLILRGRAKRESSIDELPFEIPLEQTLLKIHLILLDNGRSHILESRYKELLACIDCGACNGACPAYLSDKPLTPSELPLKFRRDLLEIGTDLSKSEGDIKIRSAAVDMPFMGLETKKDEIWDCTACGNCNEVCPVGVKHVDTIKALRESMVMEKAVMPSMVSGTLKSIEDRGYPWRGTTLTRIDWAHGLDIKTLAEDSDIDILYWVGCTEALESKSVNIAKAMGKLFKLAGIKVGILGTEESCCGEPARRLGNEYLFQIQAGKNIERMKSYNVRKIVTACPHCYNTIKNEYPDFGGEFEVIDHTQFIASLLNEGRLRIHEGERRVVTYHDPCCLGRYNGIYELPRQILNNMPDVTVVEMKLNRERSFCCGGGGGHMWLEENLGRRIGEMRLEQAIDTGAQILATACPFCLQMFDDATKAKGVDDSPKIMDIAELIAELAI
jgi:Fe-S oxidoreductase